MINLLPTETKRQYRAARMNVLLLRYNLLLIAASVFLTLAIAVSYVYLSSVSRSADATVADNNQKAMAYSDVKAKADAFSAQLNDARTTLDGQISYSKALLSIANAMPSGSSLNTVKLDSTSFGTPLQLTFNIESEDIARRLLRQLEDSPVISNVSRGDVTIQTNNEYPYSMPVTLTLTKEVAL